MTLRAGLAATLWVALFATSSVRAEFGTPYITPSHPVLGETVSFNIYQGGCDGIAGADAPEVTQQGSYIYVLAQGVRYTNPELCTLTYGVATYAIGAYPIGDYAMQLDLRYPTIGGDFVTETLGVVRFSVLEGAPIQPAVGVPSLGRLGLIALTLLIILTAALRFAERTRAEVERDRTRARADGWVGATMAGEDWDMSGRTLMWVLRSVAFGLFALFLLGKFVLGDRAPINCIGAIVMGGACLYSIVGARASSYNDKKR